MSNLNTLDEAREKVITLINEDEHFLQEISKLINYYSYIFFETIKAKPEREEFQNHFFDYVKELIINGFTSGLDLIRHEQTKIEDDFFLNPNGIVREQIIPVINEASNNNLQQFVSTEQTQQFEMWLLEIYPDTENRLLQTKKEIALYGVYRAFLQERERRNILIKAEDPKIFKSILHRADDLLFVSPQFFLSCQYFNGNSETWYLNQSLAVDNSTNHLVGIIQINYIDAKQHTHLLNHLPYANLLPIYNQDVAYIHVSVNKNMVKKGALLHLIELIHKQLETRMNLNQDQVHVSIAETDNFLTYQNS